MKLLFSIILICTSCYSQAQALKGKVFEDLNKNNIDEESEPKISNVVISDGFTVVQTDKQGNFQINVHSEAKFLFISTPSGYKNSKKHYLSISKELKRYNFPILKDGSQNSDHLGFIQITDTETDKYGPWIEDIKQYAFNNQVSFLLHSGDICYEKGMLFHSENVNQEKMDLPVYYTVGNHDLVRGTYGEEYFEKLFGPTYYSFNAGPAHFVITPMPQGDFQPNYTLDQIISWLKADLSLKDPEQPLIFVNHNYWGKGDFILRGKTDSIDLKQYNLASWNYGHWHNNFSFQKGNVKVISSAPPNMGGIDNSIGQFLDISVDKNGIQGIEPAFANINNHIVIRESFNENHFVEGKSINLQIVAYDSRKVIIQVLVDLLDKNGNIINSISLKKTSNWNYSSKLRINRRTSKTAKIRATCIFNTNERASKDIEIPKMDRKLDPIWSTSLGENILKCTPIIQGNRFYFGTADDVAGKKHSIFSINKNNGEIVWKKQAQNSIKNKLQIFENLLLSTDAETNIIGSDSKTGKVIWSKEANHQLVPSFSSGPLVANGLYFTKFENKIIAINPLNGKIIWKTSFDIPGESTPANFEFIDNLLLVPSNWNSLMAINANNGELVWKRNDDGLNFRSSSTFTDHDTIYCTSSNSIFKLDLKTGKTIKKSELKADLKSMGTPLVLNDLLILPTANNGVIALNKQNLTLKWKFKTNENILYSSPYSSLNPDLITSTVETSIVQHKGNFIFASSDGYIYMISNEGKLIDKYNLGVPVYADPVINNDKLYIADYSGTITCFKL